MSNDRSKTADMDAAYHYVDGLIEKAEIRVSGTPAWYGWAVRDAFLAGAMYGGARGETATPPGTVTPNTASRWACSEHDTEGRYLGPHIVCLKHGKCRSTCTAPCNTGIPATCCDPNPTVPPA